jgi:hypothetical protein
MALRTNVPAAVVREYAVENGLPAGERGPIPAATVKAFHRDNPTKRYTPGVAEAPTKALSVPQVVKGGHVRFYTRSLPLPVIRETAVLAGVAQDGRGRFSDEALEVVAAAHLR